MRRWHGMAGQPPTAEAEDAKLKARLSPEAMAKLNGKTPAEQSQLIAQWLHETARQALADRRNEGPMPLPGYNEQLAEFFEKLSDKDRDELMALPGDEMQRRLGETTGSKSSRARAARGIPTIPVAAASGPGSAAWAPIIANRKIPPNAHPGMDGPHPDGPPI